MKYFLIFFVIVFASCKSAAIFHGLDGKYYKKGKDYVYELSLSRDSSFDFTKKYFEVNSTCHGKWIFSFNDTIILKCDEEKELAARLQSGYMTIREWKVIVINRKKVKVGNVILSKQRE